MSSQPPLPKHLRSARAQEWTATHWPALRRLGYGSLAFWFVASFYLGMGWWLGGLGEEFFEHRMGLILGLLLGFGVPGLFAWWEANHARDTWLTPRRTPIEDFIGVTIPWPIPVVDAWVLGSWISMASVGAGVGYQPLGMALVGAVIAACSGAAWKINDRHLFSAYLVWFLWVFFVLLALPLGAWASDSYSLYPALWSFLGLTGLFSLVLIFVFWAWWGKNSYKALTSQQARWREKYREAQARLEELRPRNVRLGERRQKLLTELEGATPEFTSRAGLKELGEQENSAARHLEAASEQLSSDDPVGARRTLDLAAEVSLNRAEQALALRVPWAEAVERGDAQAARATIQQAEALLQEARMVAREEQVAQVQDRLKDVQQRIEELESAVLRRDGLRREIVALRQHPLSKRLAEDLRRLEEAVAPLTPEARQKAERLLAALKERLEALGREECARLLAETRPLRQHPLAAAVEGELQRQEQELAQPSRQAVEDGRKGLAALRERLEALEREECVRLLAETRPLRQHPLADLLTSEIGRLEQVLAQPSPQAVEEGRNGLAALLVRLGVLEQDRFRVAESLRRLQQGERVDEPVPIRPLVREGVEARYEFLELLGQGGQAEGRRGRRRRGGAPVALKASLGAVGQVMSSVDLAVYRSFEREVGQWQGLRHPHIVQMYEAGDTPYPWIAMELMEGRDLRQGSLNAKQAVEISLQLLEAVSYAHLKGVYHRDLKPENVLFTSQGVPKVSDWGMAAPFRSFSGSQEFAGTLPYMAPERPPQGLVSTPPRTADRQTDLFSLGIVSYEMLTGRYPFTQDGSLPRRDDLEFMDYLRDQGWVPPRPSLVRAGLPERLDLVVLRLLAKDREQRYEVAEQAQRDLQSILRAMETPGGENS